MCTRIACLTFALLYCLTAAADDPDPLAALAKRYAAQQELYQAAAQEAKTDDEHRDAFEGLYPGNVLVADFLAFEEAHRGSDDGFNVLHHLMRQAISVGDPGSGVSQGRVRAIEIARKHYLQHPRLHLLFSYTTGGAFVPEAEGLLEDGVNSPHKRVRAAARYQLARFLENEAMLADLFASASQAFSGEKRTPAIARQLEKLQQQLADNKLDPLERRQKALRVIHELAAEDRESVQTFHKLDGPGDLRVTESDPREMKRTPRTYADLATDLQFQLEHLQPGQVAPEVTGEDAAGVKFNLSDYRGRVVLLIFSANWCGPCKAMYPDLRQLQAELQDAPFAILAVMGDHDKNTVVQDTASGEIRWRTWYDGDDGPIATRWNNQSWPTLHLIDHTGKFHDCRWQRTHAQLRAAIAPLLAAQKSDPTAAELVRTHPIPELPKPQAAE